MRYCFPYVGADLRYLVLSQTPPTLQDHGYGLVYHAMCLFTPQLSLGTQLRLPPEGWLRLSTPASVPRPSPIQALTGSGAE